MAGVPPRRGEEYVFPTSLTSQANPNTFQAPPTLAIGDVQVSIDGGAYNNITALPVVSPAGSDQVVVTVSAAEMTHAVGGFTRVRFQDAVGAEWQDQGWTLNGVETPIDDLATQAEILSDATPFAGANVDAAISTRATQAQILSDATPFPGANIDAPISSMTANIWNRLTSALTTAGSIGKLLVDFINVAVSTRTTLGAGATRRPYTLTSSVDGSPIPDADIWVTTDVEGNHVIASGRTDSSGVVVFWLDAGTTYYVWRQKDGWNFSNPDTEGL